MSNAQAVSQIPSVTETTRQPAGASTPTTPSKKALWTGRILTGIGVLFLLFDGVNKVIQHPAAVEGTGFDSAASPVWRR